MNDFYLPARHGGWIRQGSVRAQKTRFFCAQVTGEQPAFQGVNSIP
ncbi:FIG01069947: hypothetical protein [Escherichia coli ISC41]|nr:FIG01069947: hypothetical protein [Escherichia coli ISC41]